MSDPIKVALAGVIDRVASTAPETEPDGDFFARIPASILRRKDISASELRALAGVDRCCRGKGQTGAADSQMADAAGLSLSTFQRCLRSLRLKGIIASVGRTCRRIILLIFGCKKSGTPLISEGSGPPQLPSSVRGTPLKSEGSSPQIRGELPSPVGDSGKEREETSKARPSSSSPGGGDTTTAANTKKDTPPLPARPPLVTVKVKPSRASIQKAGATTGHPVTREDLLDNRAFREATEVLRNSPQDSFAYGLALISLSRHNRAVKMGSDLPPAPGTSPAGLPLAEPPAGP